MSSKRVSEILGEVKRLAREYYDLTGKPLGVTSEVAEYEAARILNLELLPARQPGYDAVRTTPHPNKRLEIKGRRLTVSSKSGQRVGAIKMEKDWDAVILVLLDEDFEPTAIYEAGRPAVVDALTAPGSKARNVRGQLSVAQFKAIGRQLWAKGDS